MNFIKKKPLPKMRIPHVSRERDVRNHTPEFTHTTDYINGTNKIIYIGFRDGTIGIIKPVVRYGIHNELMVRQNFIFDRDNSLNLRTSSDTKTAKEEILHESYSNMRQLDVTQDRMSTVDYSVPLKCLEEKGGAAYYEDLDIVVSVNPIEAMPFHPASTAQAVESILTDDINNNYSAASFSIKVVDRSGTRNNFYANIGGTVHTVPVVTDARLDEGVYIYRSRVSEGDSFGVPGAIRTQIEDHCPENGTIQPFLYQSQHDAMTKGDPFTHSERKAEEAMAQVKNKELELKNKRIELEKRKIQMDEEKMELERVLAKEKADLESKVAKQKMELEEKAEEMKRQQQYIDHQYKIKSIEAKDGYEERHYRRKDNSDLLKVIPAVVTGVVGIAALAGKFR